MPDQTTAPSANRSIELELQDERRLVREGFELLDEKRVLLATEILRRLAAYQALQSRWLDDYRTARQMLTEVLAGLGLEGTQLYPVLPREIQIEAEPQRVAGVVLEQLQVARFAPAARAAPPAIWPSSAAETCASRFAELVEIATRMAIEARNLRRLAREYMRTDRRSRALENVLLPELDDALRYVQEQLEFLDTEEAVRVHEAHRRRDTQHDS